jgi:hypothetical protein
VQGKEKREGAGPGALPNSVSERGWTNKVGSCDSKVPKPHSGEQGLALQSLRLEALEQFDLMLLVTAGDEDEELLGDAVEAGLRFRLQDGIGGGFPGSTQLRRIGRGQLQKAIVQLGLGFGQGGQRVAARPTNGFPIPPTAEASGLLRLGRALARSGEHAEAVDCFRDKGNPVLGDFLALLQSAGEALPIRLLAVPTALF